MLQDLAEGAGEEAEVALVELGDGGVGAEVEAGEEGRLGERPQVQLLVVVRVGGGGGGGRGKRQ